MLLKVGSDDVISYKSNNAWLKNHPMEALIFKDPVLVWDKLKGVYENEFRAMVFGNSFPKEKEMLQTLKQIKDRLSVIDWTIMISEDLS